MQTTSSGPPESTLVLANEEATRRTDCLHAGKCFSLPHEYGIELLAVGNSIVKKEDQDKSLLKDYKNAYEMD